MVPVVRGFDELLINGKPCAAVEQCSFDLDTNTFCIKLDKPTSLLSLGITGDRPDTVVSVAGVQLDTTSRLLFILSNDYQFMNTDLVVASEFDFEISVYVGAEPCSTS